MNQQKKHLLAWTIGGLAVCAIIIVMGNSAFIQSKMKGQIVPLGNRAMDFPLIARTDAVQIVDIRFNPGEQRETLPVNTVAIILTPSNPAPGTFDEGIPLSRAISPGKRIVGYKYSSSSYVDERNGKWTGDFFASESAMNDQTLGVTAAFSSYKANHPETVPDTSRLKRLDEITLNSDTRYFVYSYDENTSFTIHSNTCGNGVTNIGEECDDGNVVNGDGCDSTCKGEPWYNAAIPEDANADRTVTKADYDAVINYINKNGSSTKVIPGKVPTPRYPDTNNDGSVSALDALKIMNWITSRCGNGIVEASLGEKCDDGNSVAYDGCSSTCTIEAGYICSGATPCTRCGNGTIDPGEECDDKNAVNGDGCSSSCKFEPWFNAALPEDANGDGQVTKADYDSVISFINSHPGAKGKVVKGTVPTPRYPDTNNDGSVNATDSLQILKRITSCGNGKVEGTEQCDAGGQNGKACTASYGQSCNFCDTSCLNKVVVGPYCGDGILQTQNDEQCDAGSNGSPSCAKNCKLALQPF